jgi:hypothetical protein
MAQRATTITTCDRCGRADQSEKNEAFNNAQGRLPRGWQRVTTMAFARVGAGPLRRYDLCDGCGSQVVRMLQPLDQPDNSAPRLHTEEGNGESND